MVVQALSSLRSSRAIVFSRMTVADELQPDQQPAHGDNHVAVYEAVFEPPTNEFVRHAAGHSLGLDAWLRRHVPAVRDRAGLWGRLLNIAG
jgi:hypothetical protein